MTSYIIDTRTSSHGGIFRFALMTVGRLVSTLTTQGFKVVLISRPESARLISSALARDMGSSSGVDVIVVNQSFTRMVDEELLLILRRKNVGHYFSYHYLAPLQESVPYTVCVFDATRFLYPDLAYTDNEFRHIFGARELAALAPFRTERGSIFGSGFRVLSSLVCQGASQVITVSQSSADELSRTLSVPAAKFRVVGAGVDPRVFIPSQGSRDSEPSSDYLLYVGQAQGHKRLPWLVNALFGGAHPVVSGRLVIAGGYAEKSAELLSLLKSKQVESQVEFVGRLSERALVALTAHAAAAVSASVSEGYGLPLHEALACGTEVIAPNIPALRETLGEYAHFYNLDDGEGFARLCHVALLGDLTIRAHGFRAPTWDQVGRRLGAAVLSGRI